MIIDFPAILFLLAVFGLGAWFYDFYFNQAARESANKKTSQEIEEREANGQEVTDEQKRNAYIFEPIVVEYSKAFFPIIILVLILRSFIAEPYKIPSDSMVPTMLHGDFILVNKWAYGVIFPIINKKVIHVAKPKRGEVVVFRYPQVPTTNFIKRVIGMPGDTIYVDEKTIRIVTASGKSIKIVYSNPEPYVDDGAGRPYGIHYDAKIRTEQFGKGTPHTIITTDSLKHTFTCLKGNTSYKVPAGHYFVMGDNRDFSNDSRFWCAVPEKYFVGRAVTIWMNWDPELSKKAFTLLTIPGIDLQIKPAFWQYMRWERMFKTIH